MKNNMHARLVVKEGKLDFPNKAQETRFNSFLKEIPDGSPIDIFIGVSTDKGSNAQLARVAETKLGDTVPPGAFGIGSRSTDNLNPRYVQDGNNAL